MEESCLHSLNQERDSIKRHLFRCATECRKSLTNTYRQENKQPVCFRNNKWTAWVSGFGTRHSEKEASIFWGIFFFLHRWFSFLNYISDWPWDQRILSGGPTRCFFTYSVEFKDKTLSLCLTWIKEIYSETSIPPWEPCRPTQLGQ